MSQIISTVPDIRHLAEDDDEQPLRQARTDAIVTKQRAMTPQSVIDKRRTPRLSIAELNSMDTDQLRERFSKVHEDDRTPIEKVLDLIDLPRNTVANIAVGDPTVAGVASTIAGPAAIGAGIGVIGGGPIGAGLGAAAGAGIGALADVGAFIARQFTGDETKQAVAEETKGAGVGAFGQQRIHSGDVLRALGVKNRVIAGIGGLVGDVGLDPLTYVGAPGWGAALRSSEVAGRAATLAPEAATAIRAGIAEAAAGRAETTIGKYLAAKGVVKAPEESALAFADRAKEAIHGKRAPVRSASGLLDRAFSVMGGEKNLMGGGLIDDVYAPVVNDATIHARDFLKTYQQGASKALRIGLKDGEIGSAILHVPFTQYAVQVPAFTEHARKASYLATQIATLKNIGMGEAALRNAQAAQTYQNVLEMGQLVKDLEETNLREISAKGQIDAIRRATEAGPEMGPLENAAPGVAADVTGYKRVQGPDGKWYMAHNWENLPGEHGGFELREGAGPSPQVGEAPKGAAGQQVAFDIRGNPIDHGPEVIQQPLPDWLAPHEELSQAASRAAFEANQKRDEIFKRIDFLKKSSQAAFDSLDPDAAAKSLNGVQDYLAQAEAVRIAGVEQDSAMASKRLFDELKQHGGLAEMGHEDLTKQLGDGELARLLIEDPEALDRLSTAAQARLTAANQHYQAMRMPLDQALNDQDKAFVGFIKSQMGLDNDAMALSWAGPLAAGLKEQWGDNGLTRRLESVDRFWRDTFGARGGTVRSKLAHLRAMSSKSTDNGRLVRQELERGVMRAINDAGLDGQSDDVLPQAMRYVHLRASELANGGIQDHRYYNWAPDKFGPKIVDGVIQNPSALHEAVRAMKADGLLNNEKLIAALDKTAGEIEGLYRAALDSAATEGIRHVGQPGYTGPNLPTSEGEKLIREQFERTGTNPTKGPLSPRSMSVVRYQDPAIPAEEGNWRSFHLTDSHLLTTYPDIPEHILKERAKQPRWRYPVGGGEPTPIPHADEYLQTPEQAIMEKYSANPAVGKAKVEARESAKRFAELMKKDPEFAEKAKTIYRPRMVDPVELNQLHDMGYFDDMTGGVRTAEGLFDTDAGSVMESYFASAQRIASNKAMMDHIYKTSIRYDPAKFTGVAAQNGREFEMANKVKAKVLKQKSRWGEVNGVQIGNQKFRALDSKFADETLVRKMMGLYDVDVHSLMMPSEQADFIEDAAKTFDEGTFGRLLQGLDKLTGIWKGLTLSHPSWMINDALGNAWNSITGGAKVEHLFHPGDLKDMIQLVRKGQQDKDFAKGISFVLPQGTINGDELLQLLNDHNISHNNLSLETMARYIDKNPGILSATHRTMSQYLGPWFRVNQQINDVQRGMAFLSHLKQGNTVNEAAAKTLRSMFDFGDMTNVERQVFRRLIPFFSWVRANAGYQLNLLMRRPSYAALAPKLRTALEESIAGESAVPQEQRPSWMREALAAQVGSDPDSRFGLLIGQGAIPTTDVYNYLAPLVGVDGALKFLNYFVSNLNPTITTPLQLGTGVDFFSRRTIGADIGADMTPAEAVLGNLRPVSEYGPGGKVAQALDRSVWEGGARALIGGRIQSMDEARLTSTVEREANDRAMALRAAVNRAERLHDKGGSQKARAMLLKHYELMQSRGIRIPKWAEEQLAEFAQQT